MFCKYCGQEIAPNTFFCPACGKFVSDSNQSQEDNPTPTVSCTEDTVDVEEKDELSGSILKFSILGLAFGSSGLLSLLGLIFSIVSKCKLNSYLKKFGETTGRATVGKHLGIAAMITSIVMIPIFLLYYIAYFLYFLILFTI